MAGKDWDTLCTSYTTMVEMAQLTVKKNASRKALAWRPVKRVFQKEVGTAKPGEKAKMMSFTELDATQYLTFAEVGARLESMARALQHLGLKQGDVVALCEETCPEWFMLCHATWQASLIAATVYANLGDEGMSYAVNQTESKLILVNGSVVRHLLSLNLESIKTIVYTGDLPKEGLTGCDLGDCKVLSFAELVELGANKEKVKAAAPVASDTSLIMYTSGTTGTPKGVVMTHANMVAALEGMQRRFALMMPGGLAGHTYVAYLPLAHVLELMAENAHFSNGAMLGYGSPRTITDAFAVPHGDIAEFKPSTFCGVPRVFDTIKKTAEGKLSKAPALAQVLFKKGYEWRKAALAAGRDTPLWNLILFKKFANMLGGNVVAIVSGGAPLNALTQEFMRVCFLCSVGQGYGLTETCASLTLQHFCDDTPGSVGAVQSGCEVRLVDIPEMNYLSTDKPYPRGEIQARGPVITKGYYKLPDKTAEAFLPGGWFATGDVGMFMPDGSLRVIDRIKNLVKLAMGEYVALEKLESTYGASPFVMPNGICCVADSDKTFVVALILANKDHIKGWAKSAGVSGSPDDLLNSPELLKEVEASLEATAKQAKLKAFEKVKKFRLFTDEWTPDNGCLTAAMKLKRQTIHQNYKGDIDAMYK